MAQTPQTPVRLDDTDRKILSLLQQDSSLPLEEVAEAIEDVSDFQCGEPQGSAAGTSIKSLTCTDDEDTVEVTDYGNATGNALNMRLLNEVYLSMGGWVESGVAAGQNWQVTSGLSDSEHKALARELDGVIVVIGPVEG